MAVYINERCYADDSDVAVLITALRERIRTLEAGIEQGAAYCDEWAQYYEMGNDSVSDAARACRHRERAARLRALLE